MSRKTTRRSTKAVTFQTHAFEACLSLDTGLAKARVEYAQKPAEERRKAAEWEYDASIAGQMFSRTLAASGRDAYPFGESRWPTGVLALAIDPLYGPAILTVGSYEFQLGRKVEAMRLFLSLTKLPATEPDLPVIIDKAGDFLLDEKDVESARDLYAAAESAYPDVATYPVGLGYCLGKLGDLEAAVSKAERAVELVPDDSHHLSDLGWALFEAGRLNAAEDVLVRAVALATPDYELPRENLRYVREQMTKMRPSKR